MLPINAPMYNKHKRKKKKVGYHISLFIMAISKTGVRVGGVVTDVYIKVYNVHHSL